MRGEVFLPRRSFERINKEREDEGEPLFANPRNAAAGTMRNLEPALVAKRRLGAFMYQLVLPATRLNRTFRRLQPEAGSRDSPTNAAGSPVVGTARRTPLQACNDIDEVVAFCRDWADGRRSLEFDTDGVVIKVDDLALRTRSARPRSFHAGRLPSSFRRSRRTRSC